MNKSVYWSQRPLGFAVHSAAFFGAGDGGRRQCAGACAKQSRFYLPVEGYSGFERPAQLGAKFKLKDAATHPPAQVTEQWELTTGGRGEARCWQDVRQKGWAAQPLTFY